VLLFPVVLACKEPLPAAKLFPPVAEELKFVVAPIEIFVETFPPPLLKNTPLIVPFEPLVEIEPVTPKDPVIKALPVYGNVVSGAYEALTAFVANEAVVAKLELKAYEELTEKDEVVANEAVLANEAVVAKLELKAYEELATNEAVKANDEVPNKEPVIIAVLPDTFIASALKVPNLTESSDETCSIGKPDISFTENKEPERLSVTENSCP
jgi:hypothetical protein